MDYSYYEPSQGTLICEVPRENDQGEGNAKFLSNLNNLLHASIELPQNTMPYNVISMKQPIEQQ